MTMYGLIRRIQGENASRICGALVALKIGFMKSEQAIIRLVRLPWS
jgi:hypothetical protein